MSVLMVSILQTCQYLSYQMSVLIILNVKDLSYARVSHDKCPISCIFSNIADYAYYQQ